MTIVASLQGKKTVVIGGRDCFIQLNVRLSSEDCEEVEVSTIIAERPDVAAVMAYDPQLEVIVLVEQFRAAQFLRAGAPTSVEIVAGYLEEGETSEHGARRELLEETGLEAKELYRVCSFFPSPSLSVEKADLWCAIVSAETIREQWSEPGDGELVRCEAVPISSLAKRVASNDFDNALTILAVLWFLSSQSLSEGKFELGREPNG
ncbi:MAG: NUDIX hydrolase [Hyphomonas sp.]|uniref:NUDIX hydrolase n=1 Tax=Hyphomonas sp. TaxID=87 RepID=UPI0030035694